MATQTITLDDLTPYDESGAMVIATETLVFPFEGELYEVDVNAAHAEEYHAFTDKQNEARLEFERQQDEELAEFVTRYKEVSRRAGRRIGTTKPAGSGRSKEQNDAIRTWARANGHTVNDTGRIPLATIAAYELAMESGTDTPDAPEQVNTPEVVEITSAPTVDEGSTDGKPSGPAEKRRK